ncbi:MAG TPA: elongation factor P, partial [Candidatus Gracilibacteria bacterium]
MLGITDLKLGTTIQIDGQPYVVTWNQHSKQARGAGVMKTKLKNLITGNSIERTFQGSEKLDPAEVNFRRAQYLYQNGDEYEFMDQENYEQMTFSSAQLGETVNFLRDGIDADIQYFDGKPINVQLQPKMIYEVIETEPGVKGNTAGSVTKNATIETGYELKVPPFIEKGEKIVVNTLSGDYVERAK